MPSKHRCSPLNRCSSPAGSWSPAVPLHKPVSFFESPLWLLRFLLFLGRYQNYFNWFPALIYWLLLPALDFFFGLLNFAGRDGWLSNWVLVLSSKSLWWQCAHSYEFLKVEDEGCLRFRLSVAVAGSSFVLLRILRGWLLPIFVGLQYVLGWLEILASVSYLTLPEVLHCFGDSEPKPIRVVQSSQVTIHIPRLISS